MPLIGFDAKPLSLRTFGEPEVDPALAPIPLPEAGTFDLLNPFLNTAIAVFERGNPSEGLQSPARSEEHDVAPGLAVLLSPELDCGEEPELYSELDVVADGPWAYVELRGPTRLRVTQS